MSEEASIQSLAHQAPLNIDAIQEGDLQAPLHASCQSEPMAAHSDALQEASHITRAVSTSCMAKAKTNNKHEVEGDLQDPPQESWEYERSQLRELAARSEVPPPRENRRAVSIPWISDARPRTRHEISIDRMSREEVQELMKALAKGMALGYLAKGTAVSSAKSFITKSSGKYRLISDFAEANDLIAETNTLPYPSAKSPLLRNVGTTKRVAAKIDLSVAFHFVNIKQEDSSFLGITFAGVPDLLYIGLPLGLKCSPALFSNELLKNIPQRYLIWLVIYVDDILVLAGSPLQLIRRLVAIWPCLSSHFFVSHSKAFCKPCTKITFLGTRVDFIDGTVLLLPKSLSKLNEKFQEIEDALLVDSGRSVVRKLESAIGLATFYGSVCPQVLLARYPLYQVLNLWQHNGVPSTLGTGESCDSVTALKDIMKSVIEAIEDYLSPEKQRVDLLVARTSLDLICDASETSGAVILHHAGSLVVKHVDIRPVVQRFEKECALANALPGGAPLPPTASSTLSETAMLFAAVQEIVRLLRSSCRSPIRLNVTMDSSSSVYAVLAYSSKAAVIRRILRALADIVETNNILLAMHWTPRSSGFLPVADAFSRKRRVVVPSWYTESRSDYRLSPEVIRFMRSHHAWSLDLLATESSATAPWYGSVEPPEAWRRALAGLSTWSPTRWTELERLHGWLGDARSIPLDNAVALIFPPWSLLPTIFSRWAEASSCQAWWVIKDVPEFNSYIQRIREASSMEFNLSSIFGASTLVSENGRSLANPPPWPLLAFWTSMPVMEQRCMYWANSTNGRSPRVDHEIKRLLLVMSGNVHKNPGPAKRSCSLVDLVLSQNRKQRALAQNVETPSQSSGLTRPPGDTGRASPELSPSFAGAVRPPFLPISSLGDSPENAPGLRLALAAVIDLFERRARPKVSEQVHESLRELVAEVHREVIESRITKGVKGTLRNLVTMLEYIDKSGSAPFTAANFAALLSAYAHARLSKNPLTDIAKVRKWRTCGAARVASELSSMTRLLKDIDVLPQEFPPYGSSLCRCYLQRLGAFAKARHSRHLPIHLRDLREWLRTAEETMDERDLRTVRGLLFCAATGLRAGSLKFLRKYMCSRIAQGTAVLIQFSANHKTSQARQSSPEEKAKARQTVMIVSRAPEVIAAVDNVEGFPEETPLFPDLQTRTVTAMAKRFASESGVLDSSQYRYWIVGAHGARVGFASELEAAGVPVDIQNACCWWAREVKSSGLYHGLSVVDLLVASDIPGMASFIHYVPGHWDVVAGWVKFQELLAKEATSCSSTKASSLLNRGEEAHYEVESQSDTDSDDQDQRVPAAPRRGRPSPPTSESDSDSVVSMHTIPDSSTLPVGSWAYIDTTKIDLVQVVGAPGRKGPAWYKVKHVLEKANGSQDVTWAIAHRSQLRPSSSQPRKCWVNFDSWPEVCRERVSRWVGHPAWIRSPKDDPLSEENPIRDILQEMDDFCYIHQEDEPCRLCENQVDLKL